jgi:Ni/Co efflux regulator RcnB
MKRKFTASAASALALAFLLSAPLAMAQPDQQHGQDQHNAPPHSDMHSQGPAPMQHPPGPPGPQHVQNQHPPAPQYQHPPQPYQHAGNNHQWHHGDHYTDHREVVQNWNHYHLRQPPQGYEWVQDGSQFVLIAVTSGIIADIIANSEQ